MTAPAAHRAELTELLVRAWTDALGVEVTSESDFFALGGTSLAAISIAQAVGHRYRDRRDVEVVALRAIFERATLQGVADELTAFCSPSATSAAAATPAQRL